MSILARWASRRRRRCAAYAENHARLPGGMPGILSGASRRALAALVLGSAALLTARVTLFKVWYPLYGDETRSMSIPHSACTRIACYGVRPDWTIPAAITIALVGLLVAVVLYAPRRGPAEHRAAGGTSGNLPWRVR